MANDDWKYKKLQRAAGEVSPQGYDEKLKDWDVIGVDDNKQLVKDAEVKAELESIKQTQSEILDKLNGTIDTKLTGSNVESINLTDLFGEEPAGSSKRLELKDLNIPQNTEKISLFFRATAGKLSSIEMEFRNDSPGYGAPSMTEKLEAVRNLPTESSFFKKAELISDGFGLIFKFDDNVDVKVHTAVVYCWR